MVKKSNIKILSGGWIYILFTSADYRRCKIGKTINNPLARYRALRTGDPCLALQVAYYIPNNLGLITDLEREIHADLKDYRINNHEDSKSEWFSIEAEAAEGHIDWLLEEMCNQKLSGCSEIHREVLTKAYESDIKSIFEPDPHDLELARCLVGKAW